MGGQASKPAVPVRAPTGRRTEMESPQQSVQLQPLCGSDFLQAAYVLCCIDSQWFGEGPPGHAESISNFPEPQFSRSVQAFRERVTCQLYDGPQAAEGDVLQADAPPSETSNAMPLPHEGPMGLSSVLGSLPTLPYKADWQQLEHPSSHATHSGGHPIGRHTQHNQWGQDGVYTDLAASLRGNESHGSVMCPPAAQTMIGRDKPEAGHKVLDTNVNPHADVNTFSRNQQATEKPASSDKLSENALVAHISPDVEALSAEVDLTIDNMLQDIIQDAKTHVHVEVDSLLDSMLDGVASEVEASQCVDVDGVLDDVLGSVVMDVTKLDFTDIDCAVEDLLEVVVHEVKQHNQAAVSLVMDSMITELEDQVKEAVADSAIGLALKNVLDIVEQEVDNSDGRQMAAKHCSNINVPVTEPQLVFGGCEVAKSYDIYEEEEDVTTPWFGATRSLNRTRDTFESILAVPAHTLREADMLQPVATVNINQRELTDTNALLSQVSVDSKATSQDWCLTASFFEEMDERSQDGNPLLDMPAAPTTDYGVQAFASNLSMSEAFVKSAGMKFPELQQAVTPQHAVNTSVTNGVTDAELSAFTQGLHSLEDSHMASSHSRLTRGPTGIRSQAHHVAQEHGKKKSLSDLSVDTLLASAVEAKHGLARIQNSSYGTAPLIATAVQLSANLHLPEWDQAFLLDVPLANASNSASPATAVDAFPNTLLDTVLENQVRVDPLQQLVASSADSDLFAAFMPQSVSKASAASATPDSNVVHNSASNSSSPALPHLQTSDPLKVLDGTPQAALGITGDAFRLGTTALQSGYEHPLIDSHADNSSSWGRHAAVQHNQQPAVDSPQHGFVDVDLWGTPEPSPASGEVAAAASAVSGDKASNNERLSGPHAEQLSSPAVATTHLSPLPHLDTVSKGGSLRQDALQQAHSSRHVGSDQHNSTFSPLSRTSPSNKGAASLQGEKAVQSGSLAGGLADWDGTFQAWESRGGGIKAVKLHQGSIVSTEGTQTDSRSPSLHLLDKKAKDHALMLQQDGASSSEGTQIGSRQLLLPLGQDATNSPDCAVGSADLDGFATAVTQPTDAQTDRWGLAPFSGYSAQLWQKASDRAMEGYTAAKQAVQEHSVSTGAVSLQNRGAQLARTISDKAGPALSDVAAKTAAVGSSILEKASVVVDSAGNLTEAERQLQPTAAEMRYALGDVFGLSQEQVDAVAEAGSRSLASWGVARWRSWASQAE